MNKKFLIFGIVFLLSFYLVNALGEPTQQYNKILLTPFYLESMTANVNYSYALNVNPYDRITSVKSAIISMNIYMNPAVTFKIWVNGISCFTSNFTISTTYSGASQSRIDFDCSNVINKAGDYSVKISSSKNTGSSTIWADITYMNNPSGTTEIFGTEYKQEDKATIFLQLKDSQGNPEEGGNCIINAYYPQNINSSHLPYLIDAPMLYLNGSKGIYYYDINSLPDDIGVYMLDASCSYSHSGGFIYFTTEDETKYPIRNISEGTYIGDSIFLNSYDEWIYTKCTSGTGKVCSAIFNFNVSYHFDNFNISGLNLFYMGESSVANTLLFYWYNWSSNSYVLLPNTLLMSNTASATTPIGIGDFVSNTIPTSAISNITGNRIIRIKYYTNYTTSFSQFDNWLNIQAFNSFGAITDLKGSGEIHISEKENLTCPTINDVWNYTNRTLTYYPEYNITNLTFELPEYNFTNLTFECLYTFNFSNETGNITTPIGLSLNMNTISIIFFIFAILLVIGALLFKIPILATIAGIIFIILGISILSLTIAFGMISIVVGIVCFIISLGLMN